MRYDFYNKTGNSPQLVETTEERMAKNERSRVMTMIRQYSRNPQRWSPKMVLKLQQMADTYDIAWSPQRPDPGFLRKAAATVGGVADTMAFDLIPDKMYSAPGTENAAMLGKALGIPVSIAAAILTGGGTAAAAGGLGAAAKGGAMASKSLMGMKGSNLAAKAAGYIPGVALGSQVAGRAQTTLAPLLAKAGVGGNWVKGGVAAAGRQNKRKALEELMTLRGGVDNARAIELMKTGGFNRKEIEAISKHILAPKGWKRGELKPVTEKFWPKGVNTTGQRATIPPTIKTTQVRQPQINAPDKASVDAMISAASSGAVSGGALNSQLIVKLAQNKMGMKVISKSNLPKIKEWVKRTVPDAPQSVVDDLAKEILDSGAKTTSDLFKMGATMAGEGAQVAAATSPQWGQMAQAAGMLGVSAMPTMAGMDPAIDPLRPYYSATTG